MNWSSIKNYMIAILLLANLFLVYNIVRQDRTRNYISDEEISDAVELLSERGLIVPRSSIPTKKFKANVYESLYNDEYYITAAQALTDSPRDLLLSLPDGGFSITAKNGETVEFDTEFGFIYSKYDTFDDLAYTDITADNFSEYAIGWEELSGARLKSLSDTATDFLDSRVPSDYLLSARVTEGYYDPISGYFFILAEQCVNGYEVYSHYAICVFSDSELVYSKGRWYFAPFDENYNTELQDQINILFANLTALEAEASTAFEGETDGIQEGTNAKDMTEKYEIPAVKTVSSCYVIYWSADRTALYFTPAWQIEHINGLTVVYNATNSTIYSMKN